MSRQRQPLDPERRRLYARLARVVGRDGRSRDLLSLEEATRRLRPFARRYVGLRAIPVRQIVGTDSREADFDRAFRPRRPALRERWRALERAFPDADFPPIVVNRLGDAYFVVDGHHRVASARRQRLETIDAEVTELTARWHLPADADVVELIHAEQERLFMEETGLAQARPGVRIRFSLPVGYVQLLENVQLHGYHRMLDEGRALPRAEIAEDWYASVYLPTVEAIHTERLDEVCPEVTDPDRFLWVAQRRSELAPEHGRRPLGDAARIATQELARQRRNSWSRFGRAAPSGA